MNGPGARWAPGYLIALFLVLAPITDLLLRAGPPAPADVEWRYGVAGFFSRSMGVVFLGLLIAMVVAAILKHRRTLRVLSFLSFVGAFGLLGLTGLFTLDGLQLRSTVNEVFQRPFEISAVIALSKYAVGTVITVLFTRAGLKASSRIRVRDSGTAPLVMVASERD